jgi:hypothetical protein
MLNLMLSVLVVVFSLIIAFQDFKHRLIHVWALSLYSLATIFLFFSSGHSAEEFFLNLFFTLIYFTTCYFGLYIYYRHIYRSNVVIFDNLIGLGDVWVLISTCMLLTPEQQLLFNLFIFVFSALIGFLFWRFKNIPLAGIAVLAANFVFFFVLDLT